MLIVGAAVQALGGTGLGVAVRIEHQVTDRTSIGFDVMGGRVDGDEVVIDGDTKPVKHTVISVRGFGRGSPRTHDWTAITYGLGFTWMDTGLLTAALQGGLAVSAPNDVFVPYVTLGVAPVLVLSQGAPFGVSHGSQGKETPRSDVFVYGDVGFVVPLGDTENRLSLDLALAQTLLRRDGLWSLSVADAQR